MKPRGGIQFAAFPAMLRFRYSLLASAPVAAALVGACSPDTDGAAPASPLTAGMYAEQAHFDQAPRHGGIVGTFGRLYYELVRRDDGLHRFYVSDASRSPIPLREVGHGRIRFVAARGTLTDEAELGADAQADALVPVRPLPARGGGLQVEVTVRGVRIRTEFSAALLEEDAHFERGAHQHGEPEEFGFPPDERSRAQP